jgi:HEAT repeat protein
MLRSPIELLLAALLLSCDVAAAPRNPAPAAAAGAAQSTATPAQSDTASPAGGPQVDNARIERATAGGDLTTTLDRLATEARGAFWVAYTVPMVAGQHYTCCWNGDWNGKRSRNWQRGPCRLEGNNQGWGSSDQDRHLPAGPLMVLLRSEDDRLTEARAVSQSCPLDAGGLRFVWLDGVDSGDSIDALARIARRGGTRRHKHDAEEAAVMVIAYHGVPAADVVLEELAGEGQAEDVREAAIFWMGLVRGRRGYEVLSRIVREDPDDDIREKAIFSLSQSDVPEAGVTIAEVARSDKSAKVRGQALFWLAQMGDARAVPAILDAIERDPAMREEAVFALTQLPDDQGLEHLERLARRNGDPEVRAKALFWLSQEHTDKPETILEAVFDDPDAGVREQAVFALSQLDDGRGTPLLVRVVRESRDPEVRKKALFWLGQSDDPAALDALSELLED